MAKTTVMKPPIARMKANTCAAPNRLPRLNGPTCPVSGSWMPYRPLTGASSSSATRSPKSSGDSICWNEPAIGLPSASSWYWPEGMNSTTTQTRIVTRIRIVNGDGNPRFLSDGPAGAALIVILPGLG